MTSLLTFRLSKLSQTKRSFWSIWMMWNILWLSPCTENRCDTDVSLRFYIILCLCAFLWNKRGYVPCPNSAFYSSTSGVKTYQRTAALPHWWHLGGRPQPKKPIFSSGNGSYHGEPCNGILLGRTESMIKKTSSDPRPIGSWIPWMRNSDKPKLLAVSGNVDPVPAASLRRKGEENQLLVV